MDRIDLHTHTYFSDGTLSPAQLLKLASVKKLRAISITDHDTVSGLAEGARAAAAYGIDFVPGIEISSQFGEKEIHILGLFIDKDSEVLKNSLPDMAASREKRNIEMVNRLNSAGVNITIERLKQFVQESGDVSITRAHFAKAIVEAGYAKNNDHAFERYLIPGCETYVTRNIINSRRAIRMICESGGIPVLAHPLRYRMDICGIDKMVEALAEQGLVGIECLYTGYSLSDQERLNKIANKYRLTISGGSDFHGDNKANHELGTGYGKLKVPYSVYENLKHVKDALAKTYDCD